MAVQKRTSGLDWEDLRVFVALARTGSLSAAARSLRVSHATVGRRVADLEAAVGAVLVDRRADGYALTAEGQAVLDLAAGMDERAQAILRRAGRGGGLTGTVRLTATEMLGERFLVPRLAAFRRRHPGIDLEVMTDPRSLSLARREADVAIRLARPEAGELVARRLAAIGYGLYAAEGAADAVIGYDDSLAHLPEMRWLARHAAGCRVAFRANSLSTQLAAARAGFGRALLPRWLAAAEPELRPLAPPAPTPEREAWLVVHRDLRDVPRVRALLDHMTAVFETERALLAG
ncbi:LysR family transcriptional regulator [Azospirillum sp.]|uniref:LysR family transcriptional regulator n=1 Tax=Azospirillum sp. TaxID=34012 RepID=UPI003D728996